MQYQNKKEAEKQDKIEATIVKEKKENDILRFRHSLCKTLLTEITQEIIQDMEVDGGDYFICADCYLKAVDNDLNTIASEMLDNFQDTYDEEMEDHDFIFEKYIKHKLCFDVESSDYPLYECECNM